jgi:hypothetical protein
VGGPLRQPITVDYVTAVEFKFECRTTQFTTLTSRINSLKFFDPKPAVNHSSKCLHQERRQLLFPLLRQRSGKYSSRKPLEPPLPAVSATTQKPPFSDAAPAVDFATKGLATTTVKKATTAATPSLAATATAAKPTLPNAAPAVYSDSKKPALKLDMSSREMELMELLRGDSPSPTQEEVEAWSLRTFGVYRKPD